MEQEPLPELILKVKFVQMIAKTLDWADGRCICDVAIPSAGYGAPGNEPIAR